MFVLACICFCSSDKELHPLVDSIEATVASSGPNVDDACRKKITEAIESIEYADARSLIKILLPNNSGQTAVIDALNHSLFAGIPRNAPSVAIPSSNVRLLLCLLPILCSLLF